MRSRIKPVLILSIFFFLQHFCIASTEVIKTGVGSAQNRSEEVNTQLLRERALRQAMDLAIMQITGATISTQRGSSIHSQELTSIRNGKIDEKNKIKTQNKADAISRTEGHAILVEIINEWQENGNYYVKAKFDVSTPEEIKKTHNCGYFWEQAGKPPISITFSETINGKRKKSVEHPTLVYIQDNLNRNGVSVTTGDNEKALYLIKIKQDADIKKFSRYNTITANCRLSYQILDTYRQQFIAEYRTKHGPQGGFSLEQTKEECIKKIAPELSENLIRKLADIMMERQNNGVEYKIVINDMSGNAVAEVSQVLQNLFQITFAAPANYSNNQQYIRVVQFKGNGTDLAQAIQTAFQENGWECAISQIKKGEIHLEWKNNE